MLSGRNVADMREELIDASATVEIMIKPDNDAITRVTGPDGDEWRAHIYPHLHSRQDVISHWAWNAVVNGIRDASSLEGWADLARGEVTMRIEAEVTRP